MDTLIDKAKTEFLKTIKDFGSDPFTLEGHGREVEKWAKKLLSFYPQADKEIVLLSVWLHDLGHYPINPNEDHAITSERKAVDFLKKEGYDPAKEKQILHCVRAHRCKDVLPKQLKLKLSPAQIRRVI